MEIQDKVFKLLVLLFLVDYTESLSEVTYVCFTKGHNAVRLVCPKGSRIRIVEARYGRSRWGACVLASGVGVEAQACTQQTMEYTSCCGQSTCLMPAKPVYMPACGYQSHFMRIIHDCVTDGPVLCGPKLMEAEEDSSEEINKLVDTTVTMILAKEVPSFRAHSLVTSEEGIASPGHLEEQQWVSQINGSLFVQEKNEDYTGTVSLHKALGITKAAQNTSTILGFDAVIVWSLLGVGLFIVVILTIILALVCRKPRKMNKYVTGSMPADISYRKEHYTEQYRGQYKDSVSDNYSNDRRETLCHNAHINPGFYSEPGQSFKRQSPTFSLRSAGSGISLDNNEAPDRPAPQVRAIKTLRCSSCTHLNKEIIVPPNIPIHNVCIDKNQKPILKAKPVFE